jgi:HTH-type transcriptional regulator/antitoxin HigA
MVRELRNEYEPDVVSAPGETLAEILRDREMSQAELAKRTGRTPKLVNEIVKGKARITPESAIELERVLSVPSSFWNNRQARFDAYVARVEASKALRASVSWAKQFPYKKMSNLGWVPETSDKMTRLQNLLSFFGVANEAAWKETWGDIKVAYRKSVARAADEFALAAWLRRGEVLAQGVQCSPYDRDKFLSCLNDVRKLTVLAASEFQKRLVSVCADCGVVAAFVRELPKTASGATRWLSSNKALIQLSLRYKTDDQLWFTFFHEAAHILFHPKKRVFIEGGPTDEKEEREANAFAAEILIPRERYKQFTSIHHGKPFSKLEIGAFAESLHIAPGIVVGRLQHDGLLPQSHCNELKRKLRWE